MDSRISINPQEEELKDDSIIKINYMFEEEYIKDMESYDFPICQKDDSHANNKLKHVLVKRNYSNQGNNKEVLVTTIEPACDVCLQNSSELALDLKQFLLKTYHVANKQCDKNQFKDCIDEIMSQLEDSLIQLQEMKGRIQIYCEEIKEKIDNLQKKSEFYPPIYVRDLLTRIKESKDTNEDEKNSTIIGELTKLQQQIFIDQNSNYSPVIKGASIDISLYYLLLNKVKCDANIINQCLDRGYFIINDIDQSESIPQYGDKIIKNIRTQGLKENTLIYNKQFQEFQKKMEFAGFQDVEINDDKKIDYQILFLYEQYKFNGINNYINQNNEINQTHYFVSNNEDRWTNKKIYQINQYPYQLNQNNQNKIIKNHENNMNQDLLLQNQDNQSQLQNESNLSQQKQPHGRRMRIFDQIHQEKENRGNMLHCQQAQKSIDAQHQDQICNQNL